MEILKSIIQIDVAKTLGKGVAGLSGSGLAVFVSRQNVREWVSDITLIGGVVIMILTVISLTLDVRKKWQRRNAK